MPEVEPDALVAAVLHHQPLQKLLRAGADPTVRDQAGLTPLHHAVLAGNVDAVGALLDHACKRTRPLRRAGGDPSRLPGSPWDLATAPGPLPSRASPLHLAAERSDSLLRLILGHNSLNCVAASFLGIPISTRPQSELLHLRDARGWSLLHYAVSRANLSTMRQLLPHMGANATELGTNGSSRSSSAGGAAPPHAAHHAPQHATYGVNVPDAFGRTALHQAAVLGHADCCRLLLKAGADQSLTSAPPEAALPLHLAASGNHTSVIEVLFRHAVNQNGFRAAQSVLLRPNAAGLTALHVAVQHGAVDAARRLLLLVFPFDTRGPLGRTALHLAALLGDTPMINMLLGHSTPQQHQLRDAEGFTAMHLAAATGRLESLRVLAAGGCGVDVRAEAAPHAPSGCEGWTPLHCAVRRGDVAVIELLVSDLGADPHAKDAGDRTPYDLAVAVAGDASPSGSSVVGSGSGIHNLDDAHWATDATATESEEGSRERAASSTARGGSSAAATAMVVDPLQGPSGLTAGMLGFNGPVGSGTTRLDEAQALAVLQTFIRLLHEPVQRSKALPPSLISTLGGGISTQSPGGGVSLPAAATSALGNPPRMMFAGVTCESSGGGSPMKRLTVTGLDAAAVPPGSSEALRVMPSGLATAPELPVDRGARPAPRQAPPEGRGTPDGQAHPPVGGFPGNNNRPAAAAAPAILVAPEAISAAAATGNAAAVLGREWSPVTAPLVNGVAGKAALQANIRPPGYGAAAPVAKVAKADGCAHCQDSALLPSLDPREPPHVGNGAEEASLMAVTYGAQMLTGPSTTPARASPFAKPPAKRPSPFLKASTAATAPGVPAGATARATSSGANAATIVAPDADRKEQMTVTVVVGEAAAANGDTVGHRVAAPCATANVAPDSASTVRNSVMAAIRIEVGPTGAVSPGPVDVVDPSPPVPPPAAIKRSPFVTSAKMSPFGAAAAARRTPVATAAPQLNPQPQQQQERHPADTSTAASGTSIVMGTAAAAAAVEAEVPATVTVIAPMPAAAVVSPPVVETAATAAAATAAAATAMSGDGMATVASLIEASPPGGDQEQPRWSVAPFSTSAAMQPQNTTFSNGLPNGAPSDLAQSLCVVSAINSPCGYSALNRAILLQRHGLVDALLGTLPPQGHLGGVLVLGGTPAGGGRPAAATVTYNAANMSVTGAALLSVHGGQNLSPSQSQQMPLAPATSSSEAVDNGAGGQRPVQSRALVTRAATNPTALVSASPPVAAAAAAAPTPPAVGPSIRPQTSPRHTPSHMQLQLRQLNCVVCHSPAASDGAGGTVADMSSRRAPPLLPLGGPSVAARSFTASTGTGTALIPGLIQWDETNEVFRTQPPNHTSRAWLHWPGEPDPSTGWLVAELVVVESGSAGGHVWLGLGPPPDVLAAASSTCNGTTNASAGASSAAAGGSAVTGLATKGSSVAASGMTRVATATSGALGPGGAPSGRAAGGGAPPLIPVAMCPVINHRSTHVACLRDGQAFRGGIQAADLGAATRLEARNGDTVALFWNRRGRSVAYTLNGRYCGRLSGLPVNAQLTPLVGLQCAGFVFKWRCCSRVGNGGSGPPEPYTCPTCTSNIDGMLIREQMLHEDPETPWLCKPSMTSLHFAAWSGNVRVLPQLVCAKGFSPEEVDVDGWTPLHFAALAGHDEVVRLLLSLKCPPDKKSKYGSTPAMLAAKYGRSPEHVTIVRILSDVGAVLDLRDPRGRTLLMLAARAGSLAMVQLLLERGLDPSATDALDREAQQYAGQHAAIFRLLRNAQAAQRAGARKGKRRQHGHQHNEQQQQQQQQTAAIAATAAGAGTQTVIAPATDLDGHEEEGESEKDSSATVSGRDSSDDSNGTDVEGGGAGRGRDVDVQHLPILAERWRVGAGQLLRGRLIEQGAFGAVFEGTWCGARVAIKQVMRRRHPGPQSMAGVGNVGSEGEEEPEVVREALSLEREIAILAALPPHERIARMLGSVKLPGDGLCLVMAYYPHTLQSIMQSERLRRSWLTPSRRAAIARQLAEGMAFLHGLPGPRIIHRDLKPNNVLLEAAPSLGVKICDFGLSRILAGNDVQSSSAVGHAFWMAPELLRAQPYDEKVDVYSYGVILYQLAYWVDDQLYGGLNKAQVDFQVVHGILRLQDRLPGGIDPTVQALVRDCVDESPRNRPSMSQVLDRLSSVRELSQPGHGNVPMHSTVVAAAAGAPGEVQARAAGGGTAAFGGDPEHLRPG
ncbi:hypothetical protein VaNZ11_013199 [Volvox africanus]|uniref:Protein kinase domain-containing protein n=1 Tax=Volvox africanus TaxID=51714 RepID=A0ABQ5SG04_9CHLO|nr:hypothetical protein VaNZ11_013199 [Volvox africanus]